MMAMIVDVVIRNVTVVDGSGAAPFLADVALADGKIASIDRFLPNPTSPTEAPKREQPQAKREIDATGLHLLPGFIDIHTHYDGQASWDETFSPSIYHGVTTLVMGNCGVGFAPVRPGQQDRLIELMEGVEEIPGSVLSEGIQWNWESFTDYNQALDAMPHSLDFMTLVPHDSLRLYVMGERAERGEGATADDLAQMCTLLRTALADGAAGLAIGSTENHRTSKGQMTPSFEVSAHELNALAGVLRELPYRVIQAVSDFASSRGVASEEKQRFDGEYAKLEGMAQAAGRPLSVTWMDRVNAPQQRQWLGNAATASAAQGIDVRLQCAPRGIGVLNGLDTTMNLLMAFPGYHSVMHLPVAERAAALRESALRERILNEAPIRLSVPGSSVPPLVDFIVAQFEQIAFGFFPYVEVNASVDYEPHPSQSLGAQAKARGVSAKEAMLDYLAEGAGTNLVYFPIFNYLRGSLDTVREMLSHPQALVSLGDAGAHVGTVCDASAPTTMLAHWALQRTRGERLPLEHVVHMLTQRNARYMGLLDRGTIDVGMKADLNLINLQQLALPLPQVVRDLPAGGRRLLQKSRGYVATFVSGQAVVEDGTITKARPGRWVKAAV